MKWSVVLTLVIAIAICTFCSFRYDFVNSTGNEMYKLIFQAALSGSFTFCGLFITIANQEYQQRKIDKKKICPFIIIKQDSVASAEGAVARFVSSEAVNCISETREDEMVRSVNVKLINIKNDSWAMNCQIEGKTVSQAIKWNDDVLIDLVLYSETDDEQIRVEFCDIYGEKYTQIIRYSSKDGKYTFVSSQPMKTNMIS